MMLSGKHLHDLSPHLTMGHPSLSTAQRQPADLTMHSADDEVSHNSLSAFPISCFTFAFRVGAKVDPGAFSRLHGWSAVIGAPWCEVILQLEKDEAAVAHEVR